VKHRPWDPEDKYTGGFLKEYNYWAVEVSYRQHTLGCYIIFCKRPVVRISQLEAVEILELKEVMGEIEDVLSQIDIFNPEMFNYFQMGNALHWLHFHGIPRYSSTREFDGKEWTDDTYGHPPVWSHEDRSDDLVRKLRDVIKPHF